MDYDISCPIPRVTDSLFGDFDWFLIYARHARLLSRALTSLFSSGVIGDPPSYFLETINQLNHELENWRQSIPEDSRPGQTFRAHKLHAMLQGDATRQVILWTHYLYSGFRIIMSRATLQLAASIEGLVPAAQQAECKTLVMEESRSILELTKYIDAEPWVPLWTIAGVPVIALFTLFELVIFNPKHAETRGNLALLDVAGGYFSRLEYASNGSLPSSLVSEFAYIAREYVNNINKPETGPPGLGGSNHHQQQQHTRLPSVSSAAMTFSNNMPAPPMGQKEPTPGGDIASTSSQPSLLPVINTINNNNNAATMNENTLPPLMPSSFVPMPSDDAMVGMDIDSSPGSVSIDGINFPMGDIPAFGIGNGGANDFLLGTDVMDLFNYSLPGIDPFYTQFFDGSQEHHQMGS